MAANRKLTGVIGGRTVADVTTEGGTATISFEDGSTMTVKTGAAAPTVLPAGAKVKAARQQGTQLSLEIGDQKSVDIETAEATSCVMVRDKGGALEYAD